MQRPTLRDPLMADPVDVMVPLREPFVDARGEIHNLLDLPVSSVARITCVKGAVRANHYHKTDFHYCWLERGRLIYAHRPVGDVQPPQQWVITPGQLFYTPALYEHVMIFTEESVFFAFARNNREMANYEADTIRITPLTVT